jgi:hypothetical protein
MSLKNVDFDNVFRRLADKRIEDAMKEGKFENLQGAGQPLDLEPLPADENARMTWWALRIMRNNDFIPDEVRWRKTLDGLRGELWRLTDDQRLPRLVAQINVLVHKINTLGTNALRAPVAPVDLEAERTRLRERLRDAG